MTWETKFWIAWFASFLVVEGIAIWEKDRPAAPRTLSANLRWLVQPAGPWHTALRWVFIIFLAWFKPHILGG